MPTPAYVELDGVSSVITAIGDSFFLTTTGGPREITGIVGDGIQDGTEVKIANHGPDEVTLRHNAGASGESLFLPGSIDRTIQPTGQFSWYIRSASHPLGDGWANGEDPA